MFDEPKVTFWKLLATAVDSGAGYSDHAIYVLAGVAQDLLDHVLWTTTACDVGEMRGKIKERIDNRNKRQAERVAEIVERRRALKKTVDADVRAKDADTTIRLAEANDRGKAAALARFKETLSILQQHGAGVAFDTKELERLAERSDGGELIGAVLQKFPLAGQITPDPGQIEEPEGNPESTDS